MLHAAHELPPLRSAASDTVVALFTDGSLWMLRLSSDGSSFDSEDSLPSLPPLVSISTYFDESGFFAADMLERVLVERAADPTHGVEDAAAERLEMEGAGVEQREGEGDRVPGWVFEQGDMDEEEMELYAPLR